MSKYSHDVAWFSALTSSVQCREEASPTSCCTSSVNEVLLLTSLPRPQLAKLSVRQTHLVPVQCRLVDLFHRAWLQSVNKSAKKKKERGRKKKRKWAFQICVHIKNRWSRPWRFSVTELWCRLRLLAQDDSVFQAFLEVGPDGTAGDVFDPDPELLFLLRVVLLCNLVGNKGQRSHVCSATKWVALFKNSRCIHTSFFCQQWNSSPCPQWPPTSTLLRYKNSIFLQLLIMEPRKHQGPRWW